MQSGELGGNPKSWAGWRRAHSAQRGGPPQPPQLKLLAVHPPACQHVLNHWWHSAAAPLQLQWPLEGGAAAAGGPPPARPPACGTFPPPHLLLTTLLYATMHPPLPIVRGEAGQGSAVPLPLAAGLSSLRLHCRNRDFYLCPPLLYLPYIAVRHKVHSGSLAYKSTCARDPVSSNSSVVPLLPMVRGYVQRGIV